VAPTVFLSKLAAFQFLAGQLGFIGAVYFGFAVADGRLRSLMIELPVAGAFLLLSTPAPWVDAPLFLAAGYVAHGVWDVVHHPHVVPTPVRSWYPPFCVVYDLVVAAFILAWLPPGGVS